MKKLLERKYKDLKEIVGIKADDADNNIYLIIKESIVDFLKHCNVPAIWCYGKHTKMLMADFMFELKKVHYIIDNGIERSIESGFEIISESEIKNKHIDGIIISSRVYKDEIITCLKEKHEDVKYLDLYEELLKAGISLEGSYYAADHPYSKYYELNRLQICLKKESDDCQKILKRIIKKYVEIKDFHSAIEYAQKLNNDLWKQNLLKLLDEIYDLQVTSLKKINNRNVVMLCIDGLRRKDICNEYMNHLNTFLEKQTYFFNNAFSVSTSTYESLIPTYSENIDLRSRYFEKNSIVGDQCRFIKEAKRQQRRIHFYTDGTSYVSDSEIKVIERSQTATEKIWNFLLDAIDENNGLFYIHILYESHYSYPNPYTENEIIADGTSIWFDFLDKNGGKIRTDYNIQQKDSLKYLDDVIVPLIERMPCRLVLYADHGNILIDKNTEMKEIEKKKYTFHEDLIRVPLAIKSPEMPVQQDTSLVSIIELNNILLGLMNCERIIIRKRKSIKVLRSEIYNPDFKYLYEKAGYKQGLLAFELFVFETGYKLAIYSNGITECFWREEDINIDNLELKQKLLNSIKDEITVCSKDMIMENVSVSLKEENK